LNDTPTGQLSAADADALANRLSGGCLHVELHLQGTFLVHVGKRGRVRLLPYQLTEHGIEQAVAESNPWPHD
jgi:hypothetical protein